MTNKLTKYVLLGLLVAVIGCSQKDDLSSDINLHRVILFSSIPLDYRYLSQKIGGECNYERIEKELNGDYTVFGWAIPSASAQFTAHTYLISIEKNESIRFGIALKQERSDVANHFKNKKLSDVGFFARFKQSDLPREACINVYQIYDKSILKCKKNLLFNEVGIEACR
jgi:hypothetical protein